MITVAFEEHEDSPIERGDITSGMQFSRIFLTDYADRFTFLTELFTGGTAGNPMAYHTAFPNLLARAFDIKRLNNRPTGPVSITDPQTQIIGHNTLAKITVDYQPVTFEGTTQTPIPNSTFVTYNQTQGVEFTDIHGRSLIWEATAASPPEDQIYLPADVRAVAPIATTEHQVTWHFVSSPPWGTISLLKGTVNDATFYFPGSSVNLPAQTLMFMGSTTRQTLSYDGSLTTELTYTFVEKRQNHLAGGNFGWNHRWDPDTQSYDRPVTPAGAPMFALSDFTTLFQLAP